jgi:hypothetical protein
VARDVARWENIVGQAAAQFDVRPANRSDLEECFGPGASEGGRGRFGLWTRAGGALLAARPGSFQPLLDSLEPAIRGLDVTLLGATLETLCAIPPDAVTSGDRVAFTKSVSEAIDWVDDRREGADVAFLLEPTPVASVIAVAAAGEVMPQKSTYFYPKALTGLVINPHEW